MKRPALNPKDVGLAISKQKWAWIDSQFKKHLPPEMYQKAHSEDSPQALRRILEMGYNIKFDGDTVLFRKGEKVLGKAQFLIELQTGEDLIQLAKSCQLRLQ